MKETIHTIQHDFPRLSAVFSVNCLFRSSFVWNTTASLSTPSKELLTRLSSHRVSTSFFTNSFW